MTMSVAVMRSGVARPAGPTGPQCGLTMEGRCYRRVLASLIGLALTATVASGCAVLAGAAVGAGAGAAIGAGLDDKDRARGATKGALIGGGVGAATGGLYHFAH